ncbi:acyl-CoA dehydrogenase family protein [Paenibacillus dendritiformis]|uniref:acyl-CoA dehydrogenase family protein n=1 Tax=Paenibacillus dendritiformis TaxID=130049 RepID=UPI001F54F580|nr:acyl-CoA dehydrogenase family protein [Paenibacillus dendritiformis]
MNISAQQRNLQMEFRAFVDQFVIPSAGESDRTEKLSPEVMKKMAEKGYIGSMIAREYDGMGLDMIGLGLLNEEFGRGCSSARSLLTVHGMVALAISRWGTYEQKEQWLGRMASGEVIGAFALTEPYVGSDAKSMETSADLFEDHYVINGRKKWITMGQIADVFLIFAHCNGKPTAFLLDKHTEGFLIRPISGMMGARASMLAELRFDQCKVPKENRLGGEGSGLSHIALTCLDYGRYTIAWGCVGLGQACLEECLQYSNTRRQFGDLLSSHQLIQKMITEMVVDIKAARLLCLNAGYLKEQGDPDSIMETWNAKYFASRMINKVANDAIQIHGANGCHNSYPLERYYRDSKLNEIIEGTTQMHEILIASHASTMF